jgi:hypothetical protein
MNTNRNDMTLAMLQIKLEYGKKCSIAVHKRKRDAINVIFVKQ